MSKWKRTEEYETNDSLDIESYVEESNFAGKPKKGSRKNKGKPFFKCFNCEEVGKCVDKYPYLKMGKNNDKDDSRFRNYKNDKT